MKSRPIIFSGPMVRAILDGRKTQTRRVYKGTPKAAGEQHPDGSGEAWTDWGPCPYGEPGDRLWVRETWCPGRGLAVVASPEVLMAPAGAALAPGIIYRADGDVIPIGCHWRSSIHMPRWASRLTLVVRSVRVERLSAITEEDAVAEGVRAVTKDGTVTKFCVYDRGDYSSVPWADMPRNARACFLAGFRALNKLAADADPWVWVVGFERTEPAR